MTQEEKARAYDEALSIARIAHKDEDRHLKATLERIFPVLKESENERIRKELISFVRLDGWRFTKLTKEEKESWIAWLEKQGEQKSANKIEPKFKVGDWIVDNNGTVHHIEEIVSVNNETLYGCDDNSVLDVAFQEQYHLWTINDAKDGDVLACEDGRPFIFRGCVDPHHPNCPVAYCGIDSENLFLNDDLGTCWWTDENVHPATKEQCDLLFQKIKEAGYVWDYQMKELRERTFDSKEQEFAEIEIPFGAKDSELHEEIIYIPEGFRAEIKGNKVVIKKNDNTKSE